MVEGWGCVEGDEGSRGGGCGSKAFARLPLLRPHSALPCPAHTTFSPVAVQFVVSCTFAPFHPSPPEHTHTHPHASTTLCGHTHPQVLWSAVAPASPSLAPSLVGAAAAAAWLKQQPSPQQLRGAIAQLPGLCATAMFTLSPLPQLVGGARCWGVGQRH